MHGSVHALATHQLVLLALQPVVVDEEIFKLADELAGKVIEAADIRVEMTCLGNGEESVIADLLAVIELFAFDNADQARADGSPISSGASRGSPSPACNLPQGLRTSKS
jgi:hypothetical protein